MADSVPALRDSALSVIGTITQGASRFAYTVIVGRTLGVEVLSATNTAFAVSILLSLLGPTAAGNAVAAFGGPDSPGRSVVKRLTWLTLVISIGLGVLGALVAVALSEDAEAPAVLAALTIAWSWYIFGRGLRFGMRQVPAVAVWDTLTGALAITLLLLVASTASSSLVLVPAILAYTVFAIMSLVGARRQHPLANERPRRTPRLGPFLIWSSLALIATNGVMQLSMVFASAFDTPTQAGLFASALSVATPLSMVSQAVTPALLPRFAEWVPLSPELRRRNIGRATLLLAGVLALGVLALVLVLPWALPRLFGPSYAGAVPMAQGMMIAVFGFSMSVFLTAYLSAIGQPRPAMVATGGASVMGVIIMLVVSLTSGGVVGAIIGSAVAMLLSAALLGSLALWPRAQNHHHR